MLLGASHRSHCPTADVEGAAFVADPRSAASRSSGAPARIASKRGGAGSGQQNDSLAGSECGFEGDLEIRCHANLRVRIAAFKERHHAACHARAARAAKPCTYPANVL